MAGCEQSGAGRAQCAARRRSGGLFPRLAVALVLFAQECSVARGLVAARSCVPGTKVELQFLQGASAGKQAVKLKDGVLTGVHEDEGVTLSGSLDLPGIGPWTITFQFTQLAPAGSAAHKSDWVSAFLQNKPVAKVKYQAQPKASGSKLKSVELTAFEDLVSYLFVFHGDGVGVTLGKAVCSKSYVTKTRMLCSFRSCLALMLMLFLYCMRRHEESGCHEAGRFPCAKGSS